MSIFGEVLHDQFKETVGYYHNNVKWLIDIEDFYRERAAIEKDASKKLAELVSKHFAKKGAISSAISVGDTPAVTPGSLENASATMWMEILTRSEQIAKEKETLSKEFQVQIADQINGLYRRFSPLEETFKSFHSALKGDRDDYYNLVKKTKANYYDAASALEHARSKGKKLEQREEELAIAKNSYLLAINVANRIKDKFLYEDVPELLDVIQLVNEARTAQLKGTLKMAIKSEQNSYQRCGGELDAELAVIAQNKPELDSEMFVSHNTRNWTDPADFVFEPSPIWHEEPDLDLGDTGLKHLRARLAEADQSRSKASQASERAVSDYESAKAKREQADFENISITQALPLLQSSISTSKNLLRAETKRVATEVEIETIESNTAGHDLGAVPVTRTKTKRSLFGRKKESVEVVQERDHHSNGGLGIGSLLSRVKAPSKAGDVAKAHIFFDFAATNEGELSCKAGDVLKLVEADDGSGWIKVSKDGKEGIVPSSYAEVTGSLNSAAMPRLLYPDQASAADRLADEEAAKREAASHQKATPAPPPPRARHPSKHEQKMRALYDYEATDFEQLTIRVGDILLVTKPDQGSGWTEGVLNGESGIFPTSYAENI